MKPSIASDTVTPGQKDVLATLVSDAARKATRVSVDELSKSGVLNKTNVEKIRKRGNEIVVAVTAVVKQKLAELAENVMGIVRLISAAETLELDPTGGEETLASSSDTFTAGVYHYDCSEADTNVPSAPTGMQKVAVYEMIQNGDFAKIFGSFDTELDKLALAQSQIKQFCIKHRKWLCSGGYATFFLFKVDGQFFVAYVFVRDDGRLRVNVDRSSDCVWYGEFRHRIVVPQLELAN